MDKDRIFLTQAWKEYGQLFGRNGGAGPHKQGKPLGCWWDLWRQALNKMIPCIEKQLTYPLGLWTDSINLWEWRWNLEEEWLAKQIQGKWHIWIPIWRNQTNRVQCQCTEVFYEILSTQYHRAVVEVHGLAVYWRGACPGGQQLATPRKDF